MKIIKPYIEVLDGLDNPMDILKKIEVAGRTCYKSEDKITDDSAIAFVKSLVNRGHEAMIEHASASLKFICDRGVSHEIVRHRISSLAQESTRYCNYSNDKFGAELTFIEPIFWEEGSDEYRIWTYALSQIETVYFQLLAKGASPQEARSVLPNSLKTEIVVTMNMREWRHFLKLRTAPTAHPQMVEVAKMALEELKKVPVLFDDI